MSERASEHFRLHACVVSVLRECGVSYGEGRSCLAGAFECVVIIGGFLVSERASERFRGYAVMFGHPFLHDTHGIAHQTRICMACLAGRVSVHVYVFHSTRMNEQAIKGYTVPYTILYLIYPFMCSPAECVR